MKNEIKSNSEAVRIWDVIAESDYIPELDKYPLYEILQDGTVKENAGTKKRDMVLFYDVTDASDEFKSEHRDIIRELEVKGIKTIRVKREPKEELNLAARKIVVLLSLASDVYSTLSKEEINALGSDYFSLTNTPEGIKLDPVIRLKGNDAVELYLKVYPSKLDSELVDKISPEMLELASNEYGLYEEKGGISSIKEL